MPATTIEDAPREGWTKKTWLSVLAHATTALAALAGGVAGTVSSGLSLLSFGFFQGRDHLENKLKRKAIQRLNRQIAQYNQDHRGNEIKCHPPSLFRSYGLNETRQQTACSYATTLLNLGLAGTAFSMAYLYNQNPETQKGWPGIDTFPRSSEGIASIVTGCAYSVLATLAQHLKTINLEQRRNTLEAVRDEAEEAALEEQRHYDVRCSCAIL